MKILIVDDDPAILKFTSRLLGMLDYSIETCDNALDAMNRINEGDIDILITDATMPSYSGFDLIRSLRKKKKLSDITIAMLTGRKDKSDIERAVELKVEDYIVKPIEPQVFIEKVKKLTERHEKKRLAKIQNNKEVCDITYSIAIHRVTDVGVSVENPFPLKKGTEVTMSVPTLIKNGITKNKFRCLFNSPFKDKTVLTEFVLLNLDESEQKTLTSLAQSSFIKKVS